MVFNQPNGGTYTSNNGVQVVTAGKNAISPPTITKVGYTLDGWYDASNIGPVTSSYVPTDNKCNMYYFSPCPVFLHAVWTPKTTTLTFAANGGSGSAPSDVTYTSGSPAFLPTSPTFTPPAGQTFVGWSLSTNGARISTYNTPTNSTTITLYAIWSGAILYTVTFNAQSGSAVNPIVVSSGSSLTLPTTIRTGYTFGGWFTGAGVRAGVASEYTSYTPDSSTTVYARWVPRVYTLTFIKSGTSFGTTIPSGNVPSLSYYTYGNSNVTLPTTTTLTLAGKNFLGWSLTPYQSTTATKITTFGQANVPISGSNVNLYPIWG